MDHTGIGKELAGRPWIEISQRDLKQAGPAPVAVPRRRVLGDVRSQEARACRCCSGRVASQRVLELANSSRASGSEILTAAASDTSAGTSTLSQSLTVLPGTAAGPLVLFIVSSSELDLRRTVRGRDVRRNQDGTCVLEIGGIRDVRGSQGTSQNLPPCTHLRRSGDWTLVLRAHRHHADAPPPAPIGGGKPRQGTARGRPRTAPRLVALRAVPRREAGRR